MMKFIENPNLPQANVSRVVCGKIPEPYLEFLKSRGIEILFSEDNLFIDPSVKNHTDMAVVHLGGNKVAVDCGQAQLIEQLEAMGFETVKTKDEIKGEYPCDVKLNVALFRKTAVGAFGYSDENFLTSISSFERYNVKQGYAKCSILPINEKAVITDDLSIYNLLKNAFDVLLIEKGDIFLSGHEYGFIGGAAAKISKDEVFFFGDIRKHRDCEDILCFLSKYNCKAVYIENEPLTDVGGLVLLSET